MEEKQKREYAHPRISNYLKKYFSEFYRYSLTRWINRSYFWLILAEILQMLQLKVLTDFPSMKKIGLSALLSEFVGSFESFTEILDQNGFNFTIGILIYQGAKFAAFWVYYITQIDKILASNLTLLKLIVWLNFFDREIMIFYITATLTIGVKHSVSAALFSISALILATLNQLTNFMYDYDFRFNKKQITYAYDRKHKLLQTLCYLICTSIRVWAGASNSAAIALLVVMICFGFLLMNDMSYYVHYWRFSFYKTLFLIKVVFIFCIALFTLVGVNSGINSVFSGLDIWMLTIFFLLCRFLSNLLTSKLERVLAVPVKDLKETHEILILFAKLINMYKYSSEKNRPDFKLLKYMKIHIKNCDRVYCTCHEMLKVFDFTTDKVYRTPKPTESEKRNWKKLEAWSSETRKSS